jgi:isochorismate synthase EntC
MGRDKREHLIAGCGIIDAATSPEELDEIVF